MSQCTLRCSCGSSEFVFWHANHFVSLDTLYHFVTFMCETLYHYHLFLRFYFVNICLSHGRSKASKSFTTTNDWHTCANIAEGRFDLLYAKSSNIWKPSRIRRTVFVGQGLTGLVLVKFFHLSVSVSCQLVVMVFEYD